MKIKFTQSTPKPVEDSFPSFFRFNKTGMVVLAFDNSSGVVTDEGKFGAWPIGHFSTGWTAFDNKSEWEKIKGKVEFEQK